MQKREYFIIAIADLYYCPIRMLYFKFGIMISGRIQLDETEFYEVLTTNSEYFCHSVALPSIKYLGILVTHPIFRSNIANSDSIISICVSLIFHLLYSSTNVSVTAHCKLLDVNSIYQTANLYLPSNTLYRDVSLASIQFVLESDSLIT